MNKVYIVNSHLKLQDYENRKLRRLLTIATKNINEMRVKFENISETLFSMDKQFSSSGKVPVKRFFCLMPFDNKGAYWLQANDEVENPYWGAAMYHCGERILDQ